MTKVSSQGKWLGVFDDEWEGDRYAEEKAHDRPEGGEDATVSGTVTFQGKKLPWRTGQYELRLVLLPLSLCKREADLSRLLSPVTTTTASTA